MEKLHKDEGKGLKRRKKGRKRVKRKAGE